LLGGECRFVLGASGHIAGVVNPPQKKKRSYWSGSLTHAASSANKKNAKNGSESRSADSWLSAAAETPGSWWPNWIEWLDQYKGMSIAARRTLGSSTSGNVGARYEPLSDAPGEYVKVRL
jgi:polyhydroxyalkanoate synthase subunit PhaC